MSIEDKKRRKQILIEFGAKIKAIREAKGLQQRQVEDWAGVYHTALAKFETGEVKAPIDTIILLLDAMGVELKIVPKKTTKEKDPYDED